MRDFTVGVQQNHSGLLLRTLILTAAVSVFDMFVTDRRGQQDRMWEKTKRERGGWFKKIKKKDRQFWFCMILFLLNLSPQWLNCIALT